MFITTNITTFYIRVLSRTADSLHIALPQSKVEIMFGSRFDDKSELWKVRVWACVHYLLSCIYLLSHASKCTKAGCDVKVTNHKFDEQWCFFLTVLLQWSERLVGSGGRVMWPQSGTCLFFSDQKLVKKLIKHRKIATIRTQWYGRSSVHPRYLQPIF